MVPRRPRKGRGAYRAPGRSRRTVDRGRYVMTAGDPGTALCFYVCAHADDWQFFRGEQAYDDINTPNVKVVFIYTDAGDAGRIDGYWEAREQGALASVRRAVAAISPEPLTTRMVTFNGHPIVQYTCGNTVSYFLRLPDGFLGKGYPIHNNQSMSQLRDLGMPITAIDGSNT